MCRAFHRIARRANTTSTSGTLNVSCACYSAQSVPAIDDGLSCSSTGPTGGGLEVAQNFLGGNDRIAQVFLASTGGRLPSRMLSCPVMLGQLPSRMLSCPITLRPTPDNGRSVTFHELSLNVRLSAIPILRSAAAGTLFVVRNVGPRILPPIMLVTFRHGQDHCRLDHF